MGSSYGKFWGFSFEKTWTRCYLCTSALQRTLALERVETSAAPTRSSFCWQLVKIYSHAVSKSAAPRVFTTRPRPVFLSFGFQKQKRWIFIFLAIKEVCTCKTLLQWKNTFLILFFFLVLTHLKKKSIMFLFFNFPLNKERSNVCSLARDEPFSISSWSVFTPTTSSGVTLNNSHLVQAVTLHIPKLV